MTARTVRGGQSGQDCPDRIPRRGQLEQNIHDAQDRTIRTSIVIPHTDTARRIFFIPEIH
jgi:hypothetical protein